MKPAFVIVCAWLFAENERRKDIPGNFFSMVLFGVVAALLIAQPDLGQTILTAGTWGAMFFMAGDAVAVDHRCWAAIGAGGAVRWRLYGPAPHRRRAVEEPAS